MAKLKKARSRTVRLNSKQREILERQREKFLRKFGREPGPTDPIFFDPNVDDLSLAKTSSESLGRPPASGV